VIGGKITNQIIVDNKHIFRVMLSNNENQFIIGRKNLLLSYFKCYIGKTIAKDFNGELFEVKLKI